MQVFYKVTDRPRVSNAFASNFLQILGEGYRSTEIARIYATRMKTQLLQRTAWSMAVPSLRWALILTFGLTDDADAEAT